MKKHFVRNMIVASSVLGASLAMISTASAALPTTGKCGLLSGQPHTLETAGTTGSYDLDVLAVIDFGAKTITGRQTSVSFSGTTPPYNPTFADTMISAAGFTEAPGTLPGETDVSFTPPGGTAIVLHMLPVNGGNTILIQADQDSFYGVCEMM